MIFDLYYPFTNKKGIVCPGIKPCPLEWTDVKKVAGSEKVVSIIQAIRAEEDKDKQAELKKQLPAICYVGRCDEGQTRMASSMIPTQLVMVDVDHCEDARKAWETIRDEIVNFKEFELYKLIVAAHLTPREGLRIVFVAQPQFKTLEENMNWFNEEFGLSRFGDFDAPCKDFSRISFMFKADELLYENTMLVTNTDVLEGVDYLVNRGFQKKAEKGSVAKPPTAEQKSDGVAEFTPEEIERFEAFEYRGTPIKTIVNKWVEFKGEPGSGEIHNYYNEMIKYFRNITNNDKRLLLYILPRFGHTAEECWSSLESICRYNSLSALPKVFYFFLKNNGYYDSEDAPKGALKKYMLDEGSEEEDNDGIPPAPPIFRDFLRISPKDFKVSVVNSLLPIMGTLTSFLKAKYYYDADWHTTSFFSIIYAPAGTGKSFPKRFMDLLFEDLYVRDAVQQARESVYQRIVNTKSQNEKSPDIPHTSLRIIPPKNSETELLQKQSDNHGYHMFTYAAEMDSWAKGVRAAGGNKDDMIRIAWDNGKYGQQFKGNNTFKGEVNLYWNILITGTIEQLFAYFKNVENGLVTRCSFTTIDNQKYAVAPVWKELNKRELKNIKNFVERCDANTYTEPCDLIPEEVLQVPDDKFDQEVNWRFTFKEKREVDMMWLKKEIDDFLEFHRKKAALDYDEARDVFRRRAAVRGFRLGMMCYALWENPKAKDLQKCIPFIRWWMEKDIESTLNLWGQKYNTSVTTAPSLNQRSLYNELGDRFNNNDLYAACLKYGIKTRIRGIVYQWSKMGFVKKVAKGEYEKVSIKNKSNKS